MENTVQRGVLTKAIVKKILYFYGWHKIKIIFVWSRGLFLCFRPTGVKCICMPRRHALWPAIWFLLQDLSPTLRCSGSHRPFICSIVCGINPHNVTVAFAGVGCVPNPNKINTVRQRDVCISCSIGSLNLMVKAGACTRTAVVRKAIVRRYQLDNDKSHAFQNSKLQSVT